METRTLPKPGPLTVIKIIMKMTYLIVVGIIVLVVFSIWYAKKVDNNPDHKLHKSSYQKVAVDTSEDNPVGFGYKCMWIAVKTNNQQKVSELIELQDQQEANWESGIDLAYGGYIYITPVVDNWILIVGNGLPSGDTEESSGEIKILLRKLSKEFGEAQFFGTHRVVDYHSWIKSTNGEIDRAYTYIGESGENTEVLGEKTEFEKGFNLINTFSEEAQQDNYFEREDLFYPNEEFVMEIAGAWSINPTTLENRQDLKGLGLIGQL